MNYITYAVSCLKAANVDKIVSLSFTTNLESFFNIYFIVNLLSEKGSKCSGG